VLERKEVVSKAPVIDTPSVVSYEAATLLDATEASFDSSSKSIMAAPVVSESPYSPIDSEEWSPVPIIRTTKSGPKRVVLIPSTADVDPSDDGDSSSDSDTDDEEIWEWAEKVFGVTPPGLSKLREERERPSDQRGTVIYQKASAPTKVGCGLKNPVSTKPRKTKEQIEEEQRHTLEESKRKKEEAKPLTAAQIRAILGEELDVAPSSHWVRRSSRQPSKAALNSPGVRALLEKLRGNDTDMVVLKMKKYINDPDAPHTVIDAALDALEENSNCEALYIQVGDAAPFD